MTDGQTDGQRDRHHCDRKDRVAYCSAVKRVTFFLRHSVVRLNVDLYMYHGFVITCVETAVTGASRLAQYATRVMHSTTIHPNV